ncbi:hypothetical protein CVT24_003504 [Panaeolus cyanescens]|uniref:Amine oxidase domain-containing protein n=1 Tax=Panaeolus cyanescens TaxID=181874 RepID=A0A409Y7I7_9AGAR|nr:hypothetical protein CVT24_003504 [Panaeolus cyanescens]
MPRTVRVAVIGSGLAGLTAANLLTRPHIGDDIEFEVHLFEKVRQYKKITQALPSLTVIKASEIGMDSASISIQNPGLEKDWRVDVPMRSFQGGYYSQLIAMYKNLGVAFRESDFSYSFSTLTNSHNNSGRSISTTFIYNGSSGSAGISKPSALSQPAKQLHFGTWPDAVNWIWSSLLFIYMAFHLVLCYLITLYHSLPLCRDQNISSMVFKDWLLSVKPDGVLSRILGLDVAWLSYVQHILIPLFSAVCTAPEECVLDHPVEEFLDYIWLTLGTHHYVTSNGVREVVALLTSNLHHIHLSSPIVAIVPDPNNSEMISIQCTQNNVPKSYDGFQHLIFATQASGAVPLVESYIANLPPSQTHRRTVLHDVVSCLKTFKQCTSMVINHTDSTLLPDNDLDLRQLNLISRNTQSLPLAQQDKVPTHCVSPTYTMATQVLSRPPGYPADAPTVYQTTNPLLPPCKDNILSVAKFERGVVTKDSKEALELLSVVKSKKWWQCGYQADTCLGPLQGALSHPEKREAPIWFCGSYAHSGIPLLEGCVISARNVVEQGIHEFEGVKFREEPWRI